MKKTLNITIWVSFLIIALSACEDVVDVNLNDEDLNLVVIEAYLTSKPKNNISVRLERSIEVDDTNDNPVINNAIVQITDNASPINSAILEEQDSSGIYLLPDSINYPGIIGRTYTLTITLTDGTIITADEYLNEVANIDTIKVNSYQMMGMLYHGLFYSAQEPEGSGDYYKWNIYINGEQLSDNDYLLYASDELIDGNYISNDMLLLDYGDEEDYDLHIGDTIIVEMLSLTETIYEFYQAIDDQGYSGGMFSVPAANVPSNLTANDGSIVLGLFSVSDVSVSNTIIIEQSNFDTIINIEE